MKASLTMRGWSEELEVFEDKVTITPVGFIGAIKSAVKGTRVFPISSISAIQYKKAGLVYPGYLQFIILGANRSCGDVFAGTNDPNTFQFTKMKDNELALRIKNYIEKELMKRNHQETPSASAGVADEIQKLFKLKEAGALTESEFQTAKSKLLH